MRKRPPHVVVTTPESLYILLTSKSGRDMLRTTRTVIVDEIHALAPNKRGAHLALSLERLEALTGAAARARRALGHAEADRGDRALPDRRRTLHDRRHRSRQASRPRARAAAGAARGGDVGRRLAAGLRPPRGARERAPHDARLRQHAAARRARGAASLRAARHGSGRRTPRQSRARDPSRRRAAPQAGRAQGPRRDRLARARDRHRRRRPRLPARLDPHDRGFPAARRAFGARGRRRPQGSAVPAVPRRPVRRRSAPRVRQAGRARPDRGAGEAARRARPADRRRGRAPGMARGRAVRLLPACVPVPRSRAHRVHRRRPDARRRLLHSPGQA